jgi:hypothetical protein
MDAIYIDFVYGTTVECIVIPLRAAEVLCLEIKNLKK